MNAIFALPVEAEFAKLQHSFAEAILFGDRAVPYTVRAASGPAGASRFGVYRNNVIAGLSGALAARYPVTRKLLSAETFDVLAAMHVTAEPPRSPLLMHYGDGFPRFLRQIGNGACTDYVADVAGLEAARTAAYHAADARPLGHDEFEMLPAQGLPHLRLALHPSLSLLKSRFPIVSAWEANTGETAGTITRWGGEAALIARPDLEVEVWRLPPGVYEFLCALRAGEPIGGAIAKAAETGPNVALEEAFRILISSGVVVGIDRSAP